jgi:hypothetical protein
MRESIVKRVSIEGKYNLDIVKSKHFVERDEERGIYGLAVAVEKVIKVYEKVLTKWAVSGEPKLEGVIKTSNGMNIVYSVYQNAIVPSNIDFVLQTVIVKKNFVAKNPNDFVVVTE